MIFHVLRQLRRSRAVLFEPIPNNFIWMELWLTDSQRSTGYSKAFVLEILSRLPGKHYIHFFPEISSLKSLANMWGWEYLGKSKWFDDCLAYQTNSLNGSHRIKKVTHEITGDFPMLVNFRSRYEALVTLEKIAQTFRCY